MPDRAPHPRLGLLRLATWRRSRAWDLTALLNAADARAPLAERHLWLIRLLEWLRHAPLNADPAAPRDPQATLRPLVRLRHLLNVLDKHPEHRERVQGLLAAFWRDIDLKALLADFGFAPRHGVLAEFAERLRQRFLPHTPATTDLAELFGLLFTDPQDARWLAAIDDATLERVGALLGEAHQARAEDREWRRIAFDAISYLALQIGASGLLGALRQRMSPETLAERPFDQLVRSTLSLRTIAASGDLPATLREAQVVRGVVDRCATAAASVNDHLEEHGISVDLVFQLDQMRGRLERIEALLACALAPPDSREARRELVHLVHDFVRVAAVRRSVRALFARQYSMLARRIAERSAETGDTYITRDRRAWGAMLRRACGGGFVIAFTTFLKFAITAFGFSPFWSGFWAGANYAGSFVLIHLAHWTVATKQPAMTAPAMAAKLGDLPGSASPRLDGVELTAGQQVREDADDAAIEGFVDEVANLIRTQVAGVFGNVVMVMPVVLAMQFAAQSLWGRPLIGAASAEYVLGSLTLLGPTLLYAALTGVLLFASSLVAGWAENWFVLHKLDSAIRWNPRILGALGAPRAQRWAGWWRANISGLTANVSLGFLLGITPVLLAFFGLPIEVRHVTLSAGQIAAAFGTLGPELLHDPRLWWCLAALPLTGALNVGVSFLLAFKVAMRSRGVRTKDRSRLYAALRKRLRTRFASFLWPPRAPKAV